MERVLVLEDDPDLREELADALRDEGYEVALASRGDEAVGLAAEAAFDLVVADIRMDGMDGLEALERMGSPRALVISGYASEAETLRALRLGVGDYLKKPFALREFTERVAALVQRQRAQREQGESDRALRQVALWALDALGGVLDERDDGPRRLAGRIALAVASALGLSEEEAHDIAMAAVVAAVQSDVPAVDGWEAHPVLRAVLEDVEGDSLAARVCAAALEAARLGFAGEPAADALAGRFDPRVVEALGSLSSLEPVERPQPARLRGLLSLGQALAAGGDAESARRAFEHVLRDAPDSREAVAAGQQMVTLAADPEEAVALARQTVVAAAAIGPVAAASCGLECGLALMGSAGGEAREFLVEARRLAGELGLAEVDATARLALAGLGDPGSLDDALEVLLQDAGELQRCAAWLTPLLRERDSAVARRVLERLGGESRAPGLRVRSLGPFEVFYGEIRVQERAWRSQKTKYLFAFLVTRGDRPVAEDVLIEMFWPEDAERGRASLYSATSTLRRAVDPQGDGRNRLVVRVGGALRLDPEVPVRHDAAEVEGALDEARALEAAGRVQDACERWRRVAALYRGPFLEGCYMDWAVERRDRLEQDVARALLRLSEVILESGNAAQAMEYAQRALEVDACSQDAHVVAMQALLALGRHEEAVRHFERCEKILRREMDMDPSIKLIELFHRARLNL